MGDLLCIDKWKENKQILEDVFLPNSLNNL